MPPFKYSFSAELMFDKSVTYSKSDQQHRLFSPFPRLKRKVPGRPELKTFLKVGRMSPSQRDFYPFTIEWIPDVLPSMGVGELRITLTYGHQRDGKEEPKL